MSTHKTLGYYGPAYDSAQASEVTTRYAILSSQRTGSNYVCARLANFRDALGIPMEYLHTHAVTEIGARGLGRDIVATGGSPLAIDIAEYMEVLERLRPTADGYFGIKVQPAQMVPPPDTNPDRAVSFLQEFDMLILLLRKDKVAQAVSGAVAHVTGRWFNFGEEIELPREQRMRLFPVIAEYLTTYLREDVLIASIAREMTGKPTLVVFHEGLLADPEGEIRRIVAFLDPDRRTLPPEDTKLPVTERPAGTASAELRAEFLSYIANDGP